MAAKRISMRKTKEILRLDYAGLSGRQIAASLQVSRAVVAKTLARAKEAGVSWPTDLSDRTLENRLYATTSLQKPRKALPDWSYIHQELGRKGVTLQLLWQEYKANHPDGYHYSWFCELYHVWSQKLDVVLRQHHKAGEKLFVDYAGQTMPVINPETGEIREAQIFVAVLGASNYTYVEATASQALQDWILSHKRALEFLGGVPEIIVPDNLKSGVSKAHRYEPNINPSYQDLATHYNCAVIPARAGKPRDKAKVETGVQVVSRWILARLRDQSFFSLYELNAAIAELLEQYNDQPFQKLPGSRRSRFEQLDKPALKPLPAIPYVFARWKKARVHIDYHIEIDGHYYSVPYEHVRQHIDVRITELTIECFFKGIRIASHQRSLRKGEHTTIRAHMPEKHRAVSGWSPERLQRWAARSGPYTEALIKQVIASRTHPEQGYRSSLGILRLGDSYGSDRLEAAARRALAIGTTSYQSMASILKNGLDKKAILPATQSQPVDHTNIRGAAYYQAAPTPDETRPTNDYSN